MTRTHGTHAATIAVVSLALAGCAPFSEANQTIQADNTLEPATTSSTASPPAAAKVALEPKQLTSVCKAAIANMFGHSPTIMKATTKEPGVVRISYTRPDDRKRFTNDCRIEGDRIIWRSVDAFPGDGPGRWRTSADDDALTFAINGKKVTITTTYSDGSTAAETLPLL